MLNKKEEKLIKGDENRTTRSLRNLQHPGKLKSPSQHSYCIYFVCLLKKHPGNQVREGSRLPQKTMELTQTFPLFRILVLGLTCTFKTLFHLIKIGTSENWRKKRVYPLFPLMASCSCPSPSLFYAFCQFSAGMLRRQLWASSPCLLLWDLWPDVGGKQDHCLFWLSILVHTV